MTVSNDTVFSVIGLNFEIEFDDAGRPEKIHGIEALTSAINDAHIISDPITLQSLERVSWIDNAFAVAVPAGGPEVRLFNSMLADVMTKGVFVCCRYEGVIDFGWVWYLHEDDTLEPVAASRMLDGFIAKGSARQ